jgi:type I restriction enzyme M protein
VRASREALAQFLTYAESLHGRPEMVQDERVRWTRDKLDAERDARWLRDDALDDLASLPEPQVLASEIIADLEAALAQFRGIGDAIGEAGDGNGSATPALTSNN